MSEVPLDVQCFDVERAFAKAYGLKTETFVCGPDVFKIRFGLRWNVILSPDQLSLCWDYVSSPSSLKEYFDEHLKSECLVFQSVKR